MTTILVKPCSSAFAANTGVATRVITGSCALVAKPAQLVAQKMFTAPTCLQKNGYSTLFRMTKR